MIHYDLRCDRDHAFDGWFKDSAAFDCQAGLGLLECPACGSTEVARALMAPALAKRRRPPSPAQAAKPAGAAPSPPQPMAVSEARIPDQVRAVLQRLRTEVERNCDYVGPDFAEEARRIHRGESDRRGIYGETTPDQAETLAEEGVQFSRIPWVPPADG
ncbi:MAG: DUF1178 family protein [Acidisphaera sp.]|nr:DUF1178 family protein [Acidisphaera sp.]